MCCLAELRFFELILPDMFRLESEQAPRFGRIDAAPMRAGDLFYLYAFGQIFFYQLEGRLDHAVVRRRRDENFMAGEFRLQRQPASRRRVARVDIGPKAVGPRGRIAPAFSETLVGKIEIDAGKTQAADRHIFVYGND